MTKSAADLDQVRGRIEHWRKTRRSRGKMPPELWEAAARLARSHGIYAASQQLHVSYDSLKAHVHGVGKAKAKIVKGRVAPQFVEVEPLGSMAPALDATVMELVGAAGNRLIVRVAGAASADVVALVRELYGRIS
jgi:hypothetical protein